MLALELGFGLVFGCVGFGFLLGGRYAFKNTAQERERAARYPGEPWRWRADWADGAIRSKAASRGRSSARSTKGARQCSP